MDFSHIDPLHLIWYIALIAIVILMLFTMWRRAMASDDGRRTRRVDPVIVSEPARKDAHADKKSDAGHGHDDGHGGGHSDHPKPKAGPWHRLQWAVVIFLIAVIGIYGLAWLGPKAITAVKLNLAAVMSPQPVASAPSTSRTAVAIPAPPPLTVAPLPTTGKHVKIHVPAAGEGHSKPFPDVMPMDRPVAICRALDPADGSFTVQVRDGRFHDEDDSHWNDVAPGQAAHGNAERYQSTGEAFDMEVWLAYDGNGCGG